MKIAVNTRLLIDGKLEGIGRFSLEILKRLVLNNPEHEFIFIFDRKPSPNFLFANNVKAVVAKPQARHPILWYLFFEFGVHKVLKKEKPDVFFSPDGWICLKSNVPTLNTIHDLNFEEHPEFLPNYIVKYYNKFFPRFARESTRLIAVSEYTKNDIVTRYGVAPEKVDVVFNAANSGFKPINDIQKLEVKKKYSDGEDYFLFVGLIHPRKNLYNQLRAFEVFKKETGSKLKFLIVGAQYSTTSELDKLLKESPVATDIIFVGRLSIEALFEVYGAAFALLYVSYFEGFGIPIVEAFNAEIPVITSNKTSMPEICGDAGLIVDPSDFNAIAIAMEKLYSSIRLRSHLIEKAKERRKKFNWDQSAEQVMEALLKTASVPK